MSGKLLVAIDGPAASGKSSAGKMLAERLGILFFDTGIMYRVITLAAIKNKIDIDDERSVSRLADETTIEIRKPKIQDGRLNDILMGGEDVTNMIRSQEVNRYVSKVSTYPGVRESLTKQQRMVAKKNDVVMAGRDIGTVVLPNASFKFYLEASVDVRAERRKSDVLEAGKINGLNEIILDLERRDAMDSNRVIAPLRPADDAIIIHTDNKSLNQVVDEMVHFIFAKKKFLIYDGYRR